MKGFLIILIMGSVLGSCRNSHSSASTSDTTVKKIAPIDSQKAIGAGINGQSSNDLNTLDTTKAGHTVVDPKTDTPAKKKR
jgi:hypothetical protein